MRNSRRLCRPALPARTFISRQARSLLLNRSVIDYCEVFGTPMRWWAQLNCLAGPVSGLINVAADIQDREGELARYSKGLHATLLQDTRNYNPLLWTPLHQIAIQYKEDLLCGAYLSSLDTVRVGSTSCWSSNSSSTARTVYQLMVLYSALPSCFHTELICSLLASLLIESLSQLASLGQDIAKCPSISES